MKAFGNLSNNYVEVFLIFAKCSIINNCQDPKYFSKLVLLLEAAVKKEFSQILTYQRINFQQKTDCKPIRDNFQQKSIKFFDDKTNLFIDVFVAFHECY